MTMEKKPGPHASLPIVARLADRAALSLQAWRSWLGVVGLFVLLLVPVLTLVRAHWTSPQPPLPLVLGLAIGLVWVSMALRVPGVFVHLLALAAGGGMTWWFGYGLGVKAELHVFAAFLVVIVWLAGYLSAWFVLRFRNAWPGVLTGGLMLIINLNSLPGSSSLWVVLFLIVAALFVFEVRLARNTTAEIVGGRPRRTWYLLGSLLLSLLLVATSLALLVPQPRAPSFQTLVATQVTWKLNANNSPLNIFKVIPSRRQADTVTSLGDLTFGSVWHSGDQIDFIVHSPVPSYWRVRVYDTYTDQGWTSSPMTAYLLDKGTVWKGTGNPEAGNVVSYQVTSEINTDLVLMAGRLVTVNMPYLVHVSGSDVFAATTPRVLGPNEQYTVMSSYQTPSTAQLAAVPGGYPADIGATYLSLPATLPQNIRDLAAWLTANATTPYEKVTAIDNYLSHFKYDTSIKEPPQGEDGVEYFLFTEKAGFCTYFASAMAVMLRSVGVPARLVTGYLPGEAGPQSGEYILRDKYYHAWPEAWFQGYGWVDLEATPSTSEGSGGSQVTLPQPFVEPPVANSTSAGNIVPFDYRGFINAARSAGNQGQPPAVDNLHGRLPFSGQLGVAVLAIIIAGLALLVLMIPATALRSAFGRWLWHVDRRLVAVETYQKMGRLAALARLGPEASQTPTEYAAALEAVMPERSEELAIITDAYVKARFGRGGPPSLFEEAEILKARYQVYSALLERVGFVRRFFRRR